MLGRWIRVTGTPFRAPQLSSAPHMTQPSSTPNTFTETSSAFDRPVPLHRLVYLAERGEVTIGRPDVDSYCIVDSHTAEVVRRLERGATRMRWPPGTRPSTTSGSTSSIS